MNKQAHHLTALPRPLRRYHIPACFRLLSILLVLSLLAVSCQQGPKSTNEPDAQQAEASPSSPSGEQEAAQGTGQPPEPVEKSSGSSLIAFTSLREGSPYQVNQEIYLMYPDGSQQVNITNHWAWDDAPAWSPDGAKIAFWSDRDGDPEIYVMDTDGSNVQRLTSDPARDTNPAWSPDGRRIAFASDRSGQKSIYLMNADGSDQQRLPIIADPQRAFPVDDYPAWSPDGSQIAFLATGAAQQLGTIHLIHPDGSGEVTLNSASAFGRPAWSPDGKQIAFPGIDWSLDDPIPEVYVVDLDGSLSTRLALPGMDAFPSWSVDGKSLVFESDRAAELDYHHDLYQLSLQGALEQAETSWLRRLTTEQAGSPAWSPAGTEVDLAALASIPKIQPAPPRISTVCATGCDFSSIQGAVDAVQPGETVEVQSGEYAEMIEVKKSLTLRGMDSGAGLPVLRQAGEGSLLTLSADLVVVEGFQFLQTVSHDAGPVLIKSNHNALLGSTFKQCGQACIRLDHASFNRVHQNTFGESTAVPAADQSDLTIRLENASYNQITSNLGSSISILGEAGVTASGAPDFTGSHHNLVIGNTNAILLDSQTSYSIVANNQASISLNCGPFLNTVARNQVSQHSVGIQLTSGTPNNFIAFNEVGQNIFGIYLWRVNDVLIYANQVRGNTSHGIVLSGAFPGESMESGVMNEGDRPYRNVLYANALADNPLNAYDDFLVAYWENLNLGEGMVEGFKNRWDSGSRGNFFSSYDESGEGCQDGNGDGLCDAGYPIPGGEFVDRYPLAAKP